MMELEWVTQCPICEGQHFQTLFKAKDFTTTHEEFEIQKCIGCQLLLTNPRPAQSDIGRYYDSPDYISHAGGRKSIFDTVYRIARTFTAQRKRGLVESKQKRGTILDIGCGTGDFLNSFNHNNWKKIGVEPSEAARSKVPAGIQLFSSLSEVPQQADVITMWHVLEHVHNPNETFSRIKQLLAKTGTLFIAVPNHESHDAKAYQSDWAAYDVPRHLWHFSKENMKALLHKHGFTHTDIKPMPLDAFYVSLLSEKHRNATANPITQTAKALVNGMLSNLKAGTDNYSSLLYIART